MFTVIAVLVIAALIVTIMAGMGKAPLWVSVLLLCVIETLRILPLGR
ncbi:MAG: hypothetical protein ACTS5I_05655 [Rhodanobacter sp.]